MPGPSHGIQVHQAQCLHALIIFAQGALHRLVGEENHHCIVRHRKTGGADGRVVGLRIGDRLALAVDLKVIDGAVFPESLSVGNAGIDIAVVGIFRVGHVDAVIALLGIVRSRQNVVFGPAELSLAVMLQHHIVDAHVHIIAVGRGQVVADGIAVYIEIPCAGGHQVYELTVGVDVKIVIAPRKDELPEGPVMPIAFNDVLHRIPETARVGVGIQAAPVDAPDRFLVVQGLLDGEQHDPAADPKDLRIGTPVPLAVGRLDLLHLRSQRRIAVGLVGDGLNGLCLVIGLGVHVMVQEVCAGLRPELLLAYLPVLGEGDEEHRGAHRQVERADDGEGRRRRVYDAQAKVEIQRRG